MESLSKNQKRKQRYEAKLQQAKQLNDKPITANELKKELQGLKKAFDLSSASKAIEEAKNNTDFEVARNLIDERFPLRNKLRKLEVLLGEKFISSSLKTHKLDFDSMEVKDKIKYIEAVLADDLWDLLGISSGQVAPLIGKLAATYGPDILNWLYKGAVSAYQRVFSHGSGQGLKTTVNSVLGVTSIPGINKYILVDNNTVNLQYLASVFCPEKYTSLIPDGQYQALVNTTRVNSVSVGTGTDGNAINYYLPDALMTTGTSTSWQVAQNNAGTVNLVTGVPSVYAYGSGFFNAGGAGNFARYRGGPGSFRFVANLSSFQNQGNYTLAYTPDSPIGPTYGVSAPAIPNAVAIQFPFLHIAAANGTKEMRQIHLPHDVSELALEDFATTMIAQQANGGYDQLYFAAEGCPASATIGKIFYTVAMDYMPGVNLIGTVKQESTPDAPASIPCAASIIKRCPQVCQLDLDDAMKFADFLINLESNQYCDVVKASLDFLVHHKERPRVPLGHEGGAPGGEDSFAFEI